MKKLDLLELSDAVNSLSGHTYRFSTSDLDDDAPLCAAVISAQTDRMAVDPFGRSVTMLGSGFAVSFQNVMYATLEYERAVPVLLTLICAGFSESSADEKIIIKIS